MSDEYTTMLVGNNPFNECIAGYMKTDPNHTFGILRITNLKYSTHCESLVLGCSHAKFTV